MNREETQAVCDSQQAALGFMFQGRDAGGYVKVEYEGPYSWIGYFHNDKRITMARTTRQAGDAFGMLLATIEATGKRIYQLKEG